MRVPAGPSNAMNISKHLEQHRSIRVFTREPIPDAILSEILGCSTRASTGGSMQLYSIVVTTVPERREALAALHLGSDTVRNAPTVLTFCVDCRRLARWLELHGETAGLDNMWGFAIGFSDALLAAQNALIVAESNGLGGCFLGSTFVGAAAIAHFLGCPKGVLPVATLAMGHPAENPTIATRLPLRAIVHQEQYGDASPDELRAMYDDHARTTFERFCAIPYVAHAAKVAGVRDLPGYYAQLMYPRSLIEVAAAHFHAAIQLQGFIDEPQLARIRAVRKATEDPIISTMHPIRQLAFAMALTSGHADALLDTDPSLAEKEIANFVLAHDPIFYNDLTERGLFDVAVRARFLALLAAFGRHASFVPERP